MPQPEDEIEVLEDRPVAESAETLVEIAAHEESLVAERHAEAARPPADQPAADPQQRSLGCEAEGERAAGGASVDGLANEHPSLCRESDVDVLEEENLAGRTGRAAGELSPATGRADDDTSASLGRQLRRSVSAATIRDHQLVGELEQLSDRTAERDLFVENRNHHRQARIHAGSGC